MQLLWLHSRLNFTSAALGPLWGLPPFPAFAPSKVRAMGAAGGTAGVSGSQLPSGVGAALTGVSGEGGCLSAPRGGTRSSRSRPAGAGSAAPARGAFHGCLAGSARS